MQIIFSTLQNYSSHIIIINFISFPMIPKITGSRTGFGLICWRRELQRIENFDQGGRQGRGRAKLNWAVKSIFITVSVSPSLFSSPTLSLSVSPKINKEHLKKILNLSFLAEKEKKNWRMFENLGEGFSKTSAGCLKSLCRAGDKEKQEIWS